MTTWVYWTAEGGAVERHAVGSAPVTIGSGDCTVGLPGAATVHAAIEGFGDGVRVRRLSRTQPVSVDGVEVDVAALSHGARLSVGDSDMLVVHGAPIATEGLVMAFSRDDQPEPIILALNGTEMVLGRKNCAIVVEDDGVSREHLAIENYGPGLCWVREMGSTNGSELNGELLADRRALKPGDTLQVGRIAIEVSEGQALDAETAKVTSQTVLFD